ncbi:hypothetical protein EVAR_85333_1 [Eumeta japonica]|uniref:Uncharacterized protein n=1 Tax=Eumeta variegata TaxID=151549 RepID=A0A4C1WRY4_EUMVA|nr:hypothetical protein EVAR_85333_1 [Eumeta japonica]
MYHRIGLTLQTLSVFLAVSHPLHPPTARGRAGGAGRTQKTLDKAEAHLSLRVKNDSECASSAEELAAAHESARVSRGERICRSVGPRAAPAGAVESRQIVNRTRGAPSGRRGRPTLRKDAASPRTRRTRAALRRVPAGRHVVVGITGAGARLRPSPPGRGTPTSARYRIAIDREMKILFYTFDNMDRAIRMGCIDGSAAGGARVDGACGRAQQRAAAALPLLDHASSN